MRIRRALPALVVAAAALLAPGCGSDPAPQPMPGEQSLSFPQGFLFGTAIAGFQVDMGCPTLSKDECEDPNSDWYQFVSSPELQKDEKTFLSGQPVSVGPGHWELFEKDYDLVKNELHGTAVRFSIEWSRVFPTATDDANDFDALSALANPKALAHYHAELDALKARGLTPLVTLNHYTLPTWIHDAVGCHQDLDHCSPRGWLDADRTIREIAKYAGFVAKEFGGDVDYWVTENEPLAVALPGYLLPTGDRTNPPAVSLRFEEAKAVIEALVVAHARMYDAVKANDLVSARQNGELAEVGLVYPIVPVQPADPELALDVKGAKDVDYLYNRVFLNGVAKGDLDADLDGTAEHRADLENRMDFIGINYYARLVVEGTTEPFLPELSPLSDFNPLTMKTLYDYPKGIYEMAMLVKNEYGLPSFITENGAQNPKDDETGPEYVVQHLTWLAKAIHAGADVRGYFYWTLMDNYEWNHGMNVRMGLYAVDKDDPTKARKARKSVATFSEIASAREVPAELAAKYPIAK
jgi:beta-glucosidase/6-phospho-beta-glucosidase/beta-galactosidase